MVARVLLRQGILDRGQKPLSLHQLAEDKRRTMDAPLHQLHASWDDQLMSLSLCHQYVRLKMVGPLHWIPVEQSEKIPITRLTARHSLPLDKIFLNRSHIWVTREQRKKRPLSGTDRALKVDSKVGILVK